MGERGPLGKDERTRKRDNVARDQLVITGEILGPELPNDLTPDGGWHPAVVRWWDAFRTSPMAQRVQSDVQWETLAGAMLLYEDYLTVGYKGRAMRMTEFRSFFTAYFITPGDLRRNGLEIVDLSDESDNAETHNPNGTVSTSFVERRNRILGNEDPAASASAKKTATRRKAATKKPPAKK